ncbi:MAG: GNAT family N-acetyltransferase [Phycisphaeraceae bacterium]|nr:GNAT family N-acetyltransferase [Phycisphaeraceae bacterium]
MSGRSVRVRDAVAADAGLINTIIRPYVLGSTATFATEPLSDSQRLAWLENRATHHPVIVAERDGCVVGWASIGPFHARAAYAPTGEPSIYIDPNHRRQGIGSALMAELLSRAKHSPLHSLISLIAATEPASIALHERFGFRQVGRWAEAGFKLETWIDVISMQKVL